MQQDELPGTLVLLKGTNQIGMITSADLDKDEITLSFGKHEALHAIDDLLVLRDPAKIQIDADNDVTLMPFWDHADVMDIVLYAKLPQPEYRKHAIQLSLKNPDAMEYTMQPLRRELGLERKYGISR